MIPFCKLFLFFENVDEIQAALVRQNYDKYIVIQLIRMQNGS